MILGTDDLAQKVILQARCGVSISESEVLHLKCNAGFLSSGQAR